MAMRWFNKPKPKEIWEEPVVWPIGDIEAAHRIRDICRSAADSAASAAAPDAKNRQDEFQRYERAARAAMETAMKIGDDLLRDSAVRQIIDLCLTADDVRTARILFRAIQSPSIRDEVLRDHPQLAS
ncbi:hypothetical protein [Bradyrhizobium erythrophlei]|jgi:hypothetical protein|uniref:Uncharacterized protein n=1 Tax=Bradyrhizobium erythrophlei TaxID=1437360 RepID=A0A1M7UB94_9BRAD|nr:hypothetical protein SAMN05444170_4242 [Bradyrhizobium erythrophlei]